MTTKAEEQKAPEDQPDEAATQAEPLPDDLEGQIALLRQLGGKSANIVADVYRDVIDGKVKAADAADEMVKREAAA